MQMTWVLTVTAFIALAVLPACSRNNESEPDLLHLKSAGVPDEFSIVPSHPIEYPESPSNLPIPNPGGANRTDQTPADTVVVALGGSPSARTGDGIPESDSGMLSYVVRAGVDPAIRRRLAAEDLEYRRNNDSRLLERWFNVNVYSRVYAPMALDNHAEIERLRVRGIRTPAAPPRPQ